ncbi:hypothetical protein ACH5RR_023268 [Cinchona calisaya]|uniref:Uncharacterized protein n=1 Tax=Cinchona calisaya TaxID=153742 RepID=A0ABD2ZA61_9GENT
MSNREVAVIKLWHHEKGSWLRKRRAEEDKSEDAPHLVLYWLALFIALVGLATSSCKAVASGLAVGKGLVFKSDSPCFRFGPALAYLLVLSFERDPIRRPSLPETLTKGLFFTSRHDEQGRLGSSVTAFVLAARFVYVFNALFKPQSPSAFDFINVAASIWNWMRLSASKVASKGVKAFLSF